MKRLMIVFLLCLTVAGCCTQRFPVMVERVDGRPTLSEMKIFYLWGLLGQPKYTNPAIICGGLDRVSMIETQETFLDWVISSFTLGIVVTKTTNIYCRSTLSPNYSGKNPNPGYGVKRYVPSGFVMQTNGQQLPAYED